LEEKYMENASKALIMAAGILIGLLIATLFAYEMMSVAESGKEHQKLMDIKMITEFNAQFSKYEGKKLTAQEVATIYNYIKEWNRDNVSTVIKINIVGIPTLKEVSAGRSTIEEFLDNSWNEDENRNFKITIDKHDDNGQVNEITFKLWN